MKIYEVSLWPNNQPPILIGYFKGSSIKAVKKMICMEYNLDIKDKNLSVVKNEKDTPIKRWNKI